MSNLINVVGQENFNNEVLASKLPILVDFWAPWCGPCQMMIPVLEGLAKSFDGKIKIVKIDTEQSENQILAMDYQIQTIPNMKFFKKGEMVKEFIGFIPEEDFEIELKSLVE